MPTYKVTTLELAASYNQIDGSFQDARPSPLYIADQLLHNISEFADFEAAFAYVQQNSYSGVDAKAAAQIATNDLLQKLNETANGVAVDSQFDVFYRPGSGGSHDIGLYLLKAENGGPMEPWAFSFVMENGTPIDGYVFVSVFMLDEALAAGSAPTGGQIQRTASKVVSSMRRAPGPAPAISSEAVLEKPQR